MQVSSNGIALIKKFEGCKLTAYQDSVGVWTIGYGLTNACKSITGLTVAKGVTITQAQAEKYLMQVLNAKYVPLVAKYNSKYNFNSNQIDGLVSFAYNIGSIDGLTAKGTRSIAEISAHFLSYNKAGGKVLSGLTTRRKAEKALFDTPTSNSTTTTYPTLKKGSKGDSVKLAQQRLIVHGQLAKGSDDGIFGAKTYDAVVKFQTTCGLTGDGIIGSKTWAALLN